MARINLMGNRSPHKADKTNEAFAPAKNTRLNGKDLLKKEVKTPEVAKHKPTSVLTLDEKKALSKTYATYIDTVTDTEASLTDIVAKLPITEQLVAYTENNTSLIPTSSILMNIISKYSQFNSKFRIGVNYQNKVITPNLFSLVILKSGYGKDMSKNVIDDCFGKATISNDIFTKEIYKSFDERVKLATALEDGEEEYQHYIPSMPTESFNMASSTAEGFHSTHLDMNVVNFGAMTVRSGEFFDTIINSKSSGELIERIKDTYYHGAEISKTIKSKEFRSPTTSSAGICASFHSAMELNDFNKERVIDFAKNGLGRRLLISMSTEYRYQEVSFETNVDYTEELGEIQTILNHVASQHQYYYTKMADKIDYTTSIFTPQQFTRVVDFTEEAQVFLITLTNVFLKKLQETNDETFIVVLEQVVKLALNLHLIESNGKEINLETVKTAYRIFTMYHLDKTKYETKLFGSEVQEGFEALLDNKVTQTDFFKYSIKKPRFNKKQKENFIDELIDYCSENGKKLFETKEGRTTYLEIKDFEKYVSKANILSSSKTKDDMRNNYIPDEAEMDGME